MWARSSAIHYAEGEAIRFRVAGLLANSVLQGSLLIGERDLSAASAISGYRFFAIAAPQDQSGAWRKCWRNG